MPVVELHVHGRPYKHLGNSKLMKIAEIAKSQGTDCLVLTEHCHTKDYGLWQYGDELLEEVKETHDINILIGAELQTKEFRDVLVYGPYIEEVQAGMTVDDILHSGFTLVWAHPMRREWPEATWERASEVFDAIEIGNKSYSELDCWYAMDMASKYKLGMVSGSDIHLNRHVGLHRTYLRNADCIEDIQAAISHDEVINLGLPR